MSNLLLITDMARLNKVFKRLADDSKALTLRVVNNLEKGGDEIAIEKPDVVFVQTHLSGLSADILLKHLKKQLGRKRSRFVLLAPPSQVNQEILKLYQGWLDISIEDSELLPALEALLASFFSKNKIKPAKQPEAETSPVPIAREVLAPIPAPANTPVIKESVTVAETSALLNRDFSIIPLPEEPVAIDNPPALQNNIPEPSLEEQGITYSPVSRLSVYSEFNSSFDNAFHNIPEPEPLLTSSSMAEDKWAAEPADIIENVSTRSRRTTFLLWLAPVIVAVVVVTILQKNWSASRNAAVIKPETQSQSRAAEKPQEPTGVKEFPKQPDTAKPKQDPGTTDKAVINAITENRDMKPGETYRPGSRLSVLPNFIPRSGFDRHYGAANPGWERYKGYITEFKVLREAKTIKAIQVIDRGGLGVPEYFMKGVLRQVIRKPVIKIDSTEKKEDYVIQRGQISDTISVVFYRDEQRGKLRAFVMTWK